jgi:hypothetical protein
MLRTCRIGVVALALVTSGAVAALPAQAAKKKAPTPPTAATVKRLLTKAYCQPNTNIRGEAQDSVKATFKSIRRGARRLGRSWRDGTPANRRTYVFPVRAVYDCDYTNITPSPLAPADLHVEGDYLFFRDEFGTWTHRNSRHKVTRTRN